MQLVEWKAAGRTFGYRGQRIFYRREGSGPALVLIHGFPTASWDWYRIWPDLTRDHDVVAADMLGFGFSDKPRGHDYSLLDQATLLEQLLADLQIARADIVAHDYGVSVAQELLTRHAGRERSGTPGLRIGSVCFLNGGLFPGVHRPLPIQHLLMGPLGPLVSRLLRRSALRRSFRRIFGPRTQPTEAEIDDFWQLIEYNDGRRVLHRLIRYMAERKIHGPRWVDALRTTTVPLRLIDGLADPISGAHVAEHYRRTVPDPDVVGLDEIGHYPQVEAPAAVVLAIRALVRGAR